MIVRVFRGGRLIRMGGWLTLELEDCPTIATVCRQMNFEPPVKIVRWTWVDVYQRKA